MTSSFTNFSPPSTPFYSKVANTSKVAAADVSLLGSASKTDSCTSSESSREDRDQDSSHEGNNEDSAAEAETDDLPSSSSFSFDDLSRFPRELAERVDWITQCHHPSEVLQTLGLSPRNDKVSNELINPATATTGDSGAVATTTDTPYVAFRVPLHCEYCGSLSTSMCSPEKCQRPRTFFPKKRPPFCAHDPKQWDTDDCFIGQRTKQHGDGKREVMYCRQTSIRKQRQQPPLFREERNPIASSPKPRIHSSLSPLTTAPFRDVPSSSFSNPSNSFLNSSPAWPLAGTSHYKRFKKRKNQHSFVGRSSTFASIPEESH
mmetsp:Transcript_2322/g.4295  ORF Transcript_2322/g.4295 Transcript_2322/m.4295 type:complete len:318 (-) Transcript_2322:375-1328(-)